MKLFGFTIERENKKVNEFVVDGTAEEIEVDPNQKKFNGKKVLAIGIAAAAIVGGVAIALSKGHSDDDSDPETIGDQEAFEYEKFETEKFEPEKVDPEVSELTRLENEAEEG